MLANLQLEQENDPAFSKLSNRYVPGRGASNPRPRVLIIGEAPGAQEDAQLRPFVGPSGVALADLMFIAGMYAEDRYYSDPSNKVNNSIPNNTGIIPANVWITNVIKFRPPGNRNPTDMEVMAARPYLMREWLAIGAPTVIVPVGGFALYAVSGERRSILKAAGAEWKRRSNQTKEWLHIWPMIHPQFGIRNERARPYLERDWERLGDWFATYSG